MDNALHTDVLIVGGGMAGGLLGLLLADQGFSVRVLDAGPAPVRPSGESAPRVSTLSEASHWLLRHAGVWDRLDPERVQAYASMQVWDQDGTGEVRFSAAAAPTTC